MGDITSVGDSIANTATDFGSDIESGDDEVFSEAGSDIESGADDVYDGFSDTGNDIGDMADDVSNFFSQNFSESMGTLNLGLFSIPEPYTYVDGYPVGDYDLAALCGIELF